MHSLSARLHVFRLSTDLSRRFSATPTVSAMASAMVADSERNPAKSASATSNQTLANWASGENALSVMATTGTPCSDRSARLLDGRRRIR